MILPTKKIEIDLTNIKEVTEIDLFEYPDVFTTWWYEFTVKYNDDKDDISLDYHTRSGAETDRDAIINKLK